MKNLFLAILISAIVFSSHAQQQSHRYALKSGYIKYELSGSTKGTKEVWWGAYGDKTCELEKSKTTVKIMGISDVTETNKLTIINKADCYVVDYAEDKAYHSTVPYHTGKAIANDLSEAEQKKLADDLLNAMGGQKLGTEKVLGYTCEVISIMGAKSWIYKGLTLKSEANVMGISNKETVSVFKPKQAVPASKFMKPSGVSFTNHSQMQQEQAGGLFGALSAGMEIEEEEDDYSEIIPTKYPYDKFSEKINKFSYNGYTKFMLNSLDGLHSAMFMKGFSNSILVAASSKQNSKAYDTNTVERFTNAGKTCYYGQEVDEDGKKVSYLVIDIKAYDTYISITSSPSSSKDELLKISKALGF